MVDEDGMIIEEREENRFLRARSGDMLMVPFQCGLCHFRNIQKRDPIRFKTTDNDILEYIRRASLDSLWAREPATVKKNLNGLAKAEQEILNLGLPPLSPPLGPFPLDDVHGMLHAIAILNRSLDQGVYEKQVQWATFRKLRSHITNVHQASPGGLGDVVGAYERNRCWVSKVPTHTFWFTRFMEGLHRRVGEVVKPDWPVTIEVMKHIDTMLEEQWDAAADDYVARKRIAEMAVWFLAGFCTGLRGEEMLMVELAGTTKSTRHLNDAVKPFFELRILGRTKGRQENGRHFYMPCVGVTGRSGLRPGIWVYRLTRIIRFDGRTKGRLFQRVQVVPTLSEYEDDFFRVLEEVQNSTDLIDSSVDLREEAGIGRSLRRGVTSHALNVVVDRDLVNAINRWRTRTNGRANAADAAMIDRYAKLDSLRPTYLRFSEAL